MCLLKGFGPNQCTLLNTPDLRGPVRLCAKQHPIVRSCHRKILLYVLSQEHYMGQVSMHHSYYHIAMILSHNSVINCMYMWTKKCRMQTDVAINFSINLWDDENSAIGYALLESHDRFDTTVLVQSLCHTLLTLSCCHFWYCTSRNLCPVINVYWLT